MQQVMNSYIDEINELEQEQIDELNRSLPFKNEVLREILGREP